MRDKCVINDALPVRVRRTEFAGWNSGGAEEEWIGTDGIGSLISTLTISATIIYTGSAIWFRYGAIRYDKTTAYRTTTIALERNK